MKHVKYAASLDKWSLVATEEIGEVVDKMEDVLKNIVLKAAAEALQYAFEDNETYIYFPNEYEGHDGIGGKVVDPLDVYLRVGVVGDGEAPTFTFNLRDTLLEAIPNCVDRDYCGGLKEISKALRSLAEEIDGAIEVAQKG